MDECKHPNPCELKFCPVMLCLDLVRSIVLLFFLFYHSPDYVHVNRLATTRRKPKTFIEYWVGRDELYQIHQVKSEWKREQSRERERVKNPVTCTKRLMSIHRPFGRPTCIEDGTWQKDNMTWTTITTPRKRMKSMKRHVQITNSLPSRPQRRSSFSFGEFSCVFLLFGLCDGNDCVNCERCRKWCACPVIWRH